MSEFSSWMQENWLEAGSLLMQLAFLTAGVWFARNILRAMRASQEQVGALLKLSITSASHERPSMSTSEKHARTDANSYWFVPSETRSADLSEPMSSGPGRLAAAWRGLMVWLETPMSRAQVSPLRRMVRWLQAPVGS